MNGLCGTSRPTVVVVVCLLPGFSQAKPVDIFTKTPTRRARCILKAFLTTAT
jgi:hypothetical protein